MNDKKPRGFAALKLSDPERFATLSSKGGANSPGNFKNDKARASASGKKSRRTHEPKLTK